MAMRKKERWLESEIVALPEGEHDYFERKGGQFLTHSGYREDLCKAVSAFANSGGGHLIIGVADDGTLEGVDPSRGRTSTRDWLEQVVPGCVSPTLADFRVHQVEASTPTAIPANRVVLVVDIADSILAPHQAESQKIYFYRQGGRSERAPHFLLEALRNRLTGPVLTARLTGVRVKHAYQHQGGAFVETVLLFRVTNDGSGAAYRWAVFPQEIQGDRNRGERLKFERSEFPRRDSSSSISIDDTILPSLSRMHDQNAMGFALPTLAPSEILRELRDLFSPDLVLGYRVVSEVSRGELQYTRFRDVIELETLAREVIRQLTPGGTSA
jgi:hypothetical protein